VKRYLALAAAGGFLAGLAGFVPHARGGGEHWPPPCEVAGQVAPDGNPINPSARPGFAPSKQPVSPDGARATADLPASRHVRNTGGSDGPRGPGSGSGLCVFTSGQMAADWQNIGFMQGFQKWMTRRPGGGTPTKFDAMVKAYCAEVGQPVPAYVQNTDGDRQFVETALKTGRMLCITYAGADDFYSGPIAHMVCLCHLGTTWSCIIDNNRPGVFVWMETARLWNRYLGKHDDGRDMRIRGMKVGGGWSYCFLAPPPPPHPVPPKEDERMEAGAVEAGPPAGDNFGIDLAALAAERKGTSITGVPQPSVESGIQALLTDDSNRMTLVGVGDEATCNAVREGVSRLDPADRDRVHVQCYGPAQWQVGQFKLRPGVTLRGAAAGPVGSPRVAGDLGHLSEFNATDPKAVAKLVTDTLRPPQPMPPPVTPPDDKKPDPRPDVQPPPDAGRGLPEWVKVLGMTLGSAAVVLLTLRGRPVLAALLKAWLESRKPKA
jgi:hypothetical protein